MKCETCRGTGKDIVYDHDYEQNQPRRRDVSCPSCNGTGQQSCCDGMAGAPSSSTGDERAAETREEGTKEAEGASHEITRLTELVACANAEIARLRELFRIDGEQHASALRYARHEQDTRLAAYSAEIARLHTTIGEAATIADENNSLSGQLIAKRIRELLVADSERRNRCAGVL